MMYILQLLKKNTTKTTTNNLQNEKIIAYLLGNKSKSQSPLFLLIFEIFNQNGHNCLVNSRASYNVMPYSTS
jgi:hypothetical protein